MKMLQYQESISFCTQKSVLILRNMLLHVPKTESLVLMIFMSLDINFLLKAYAFRGSFREGS